MCSAGNKEMACCSPPCIFPERQITQEMGANGEGGRVAPSDAFKGQVWGYFMFFILSVNHMKKDQKQQ